MTLLEHPLGSFDAKVDDKGRLRLPNVFVEYLDRLAQRRVFITTFDMATVRIYPISAWNEIEKSLNREFEDKEDADAAEDLLALVNHYGQDIVVDEKSRVLLPTTLRRDLDMENKDVWVQWVKGRFDVHQSERYLQRVEKAKENIKEKVNRFGSMYR